VNEPDAAIVPPRLHDLETEVMIELWSAGPAPVRVVLDALNARSERQRKYTTVMTIMARLHSKGVLERRRDGKTYIYTPVLSRERFLQARAQAEVDALVDEYGDVALVHFAKQMAELDPRRREQLRRLARK
jgi:predicted transcriptional regulator